MNDTVFTMRSTPYKFGVGVSEEIAEDLRALGLRRVLVVTDADVLATGIPGKAMALLERSGIEHTLYDRVQVEPTDVAVKAAIEFAQGFGGDGFLAIGGGSAIDTAQIMNL